MLRLLYALENSSWYPAPFPQWESNFGRSQSLYWLRFRFTVTARCILLSEVNVNVNLGFTTDLHCAYAEVPAQSWLSLLYSFRRAQQLQQCKPLVFRETNRVQVWEANRQDHEDVGGRPHAVPHHRVPSRNTRAPQRDAGKMFLQDMLLFVRWSNGHIGTSKRCHKFYLILFNESTVSNNFCIVV